MKKVMLMALVLLLGLPTFAQGKKTEKIPQNVKEAFTKAYPNVKEVKWDVEGEEYEASFKLKGTDVSVVIDNDGEIEETETEIAVSELPSNIIPYITKNFKGYKVTAAAKIVKEDNDVTYEAEITKYKTHKDLIFNQDGIIVKKHKEKKEKPDKEEND